MRWYRDNRAWWEPLKQPGADEGPPAAGAAALAAPADAGQAS